MPAMVKKEKLPVQYLLNTLFFVLGTKKFNFEAERRLRFS